MVKCPLLELDQSVKVERWGSDTRIGVVKDDETFVLIVERKLKLKLWNKYKVKYKEKAFLLVRLFAALAALAIRHSNLWKSGDSIKVDLEYPNHEKLIKQVLIKGLGFNASQIKELHMEQIGKVSRAHEVARNPSKANKVHVLRETNTNITLLERLAIPKRKVYGSSG